MYKRILRPFLFLFPPEFIHKLVATLLHIISFIPGLGNIISNQFSIKDKRLERELFGLHFPNPVGVAAGFDKEAKLYNALSYFGFGHIEIGTVTPLGQKGNPQPRLFRLPKDKALINRMGFNNHGLKAFAKNIRKNHPRVIIGGNIGKNTSTPNEKAIHDYCQCFEELFELVDYFVVNVSCPNIKNLSKLQDKDSMLELLHAIQNINKSKKKPKPVLLKISPDLTEGQLDDVIEIIHDTNLSGIIATNTTSLRENIKHESEAARHIGQGGLSGAPLKDKSTRTIAYLHKKSAGKIPIIGVGGIFTPADALEKINAGASLVQVYTGFIYQGPSIATKINKALLNLN
jgi:dihydroorotate dehydrogenase